jgi:hypothetical protein
VTLPPEVAEVIAVVGVPFALKPHEKLIGAKLTDTTAVISLEILVVTETTREWKISAKGVRMMVWQKADSVWSYTGTFTTWDEDFKPEIHVRVGRIVTPQEAREAMDWDRLCYRPGSDRSPLDNYGRVLSGSTTPKMERHW